MKAVVIITKPVKKVFPMLCNLNPPFIFLSSVTSRNSVMSDMLFSVEVYLPRTDSGDPVLENVWYMKERLKHHHTSRSFYAEQCYSWCQRSLLSTLVKETDVTTGPFPQEEQSKYTLFHGILHGFGSFEDGEVALMVVKDITSAVLGAWGRVVVFEGDALADRKKQVRKNEANLLSFPACEVIEENEKVFEAYLAKWHLNEWNYTEAILAGLWLHNGEVVMQQGSEIWREDRLTDHLERWVKTHVCGEILFHSFHRAVAVLPTIPSLLFSPSRRYPRLPEALLQEVICFHCSRTLVVTAAHGDTESTAVVVPVPRHCSWGSGHDSEQETKRLNELIDQYRTMLGNGQYVRTPIVALPRTLFVKLLFHGGNKYITESLLLDETLTSGVPTKEEVLLGVQLLWALQRYQDTRLPDTPSEPTPRRPHDQHAITDRNEKARKAVDDFFGAEVHLRSKEKYVRLSESLFAPLPQPTWGSQRNG
ncbi:hypothetical protein AGDE_14324 [Angomonas deanei]|nr:hypothetical protein AGDE_14324 [Angomonas deanei]|eukprot:EPY21038.1 hypothetical protein AGDE_14324 [Angomonas deanei]